MKKVKTTALLLSLAGISLAGCNCNNEPTNDKTDNTIKNAKEVIMTRTSIRSFTNRAVSADTVEMLLRAGMAAPTAVNKQPWHFVVVDDRATLDSLGGNGRQSQMWKESTLAIAVCGDMDKALECPAQAFWVQDCSAATENILLAAHALGLGAVWTGCYPMEERMANVSQVLNLPETVIPLCVIVMGYPNEQPEPKDKWKPENISYNLFGNGWQPTNTIRN
jgi:nitroreductase